MSLNINQDEPVIFSAKVATAFTEDGLFVTMALVSPLTCAPAAAGAAADGVLEQTAAIGDEVSWHRKGGVRAVRLGYAATAGDYVQVGANSRAVLFAGGVCMGRLLSGGTEGSVASLDLGDTNPHAAFVLLGADVASATAITPTGRYFNVTGTTKVDSLVLTAVPVGVPFTIKAVTGFTFAKEAAATTNGADVVLTAGGTITLVKIGTTAYQVGGVPDVVA